MSQHQETTFKPVDNNNNVPSVLDQGTTNTIPSGTASSSSDSPTFNPPPVVVPATTTVNQQQQGQAEEPQQQSKFVTQVKEVIINISQDHYNKIIDSLKKDQLRFEYIDNSGNIKVGLKSYVPMTIGQNKKVGK